MKHKFLIIGGAAVVGAVGLGIRKLIRKNHMARSVNYYSYDDYQQSMLDYQKATGLFVRKYPDHGIKRTWLRVKSIISPLSAIEELIEACEIKSCSAWENFAEVWAPDLLVWTDKNAHREHVLDFIKSKEPAEGKLDNDTNGRDMA